MIPPSPGLQVSIRVRLCLWKLGVPKPGWIPWLDGRLSTHSYLNGDLIRGRLPDDQVDDDYLCQLAAVLSLSPEELRFGDPFAGQVSLLLENLRFLIGGEGVGGKGRLARELRMNPTTISRWLSGDSKPTAATQARLVVHFGLPKGTDLERGPVFLAIGPVALQEKQAWVRDHLEGLDSETFAELFPAFQRLLGMP